MIGHWCKQSITWHKLHSVTTSRQLYHLSGGSIHSDLLNRYRPYIRMAVCVYNSRPMAQCQLENRIGLDQLNNAFRLGQETEQIAPIHPIILKEVCIREINMLPNLVWYHRFPECQASLYLTMENQVYCKADDNYIGFETVVRKLKGYQRMQSVSRRFDTALSKSNWSHRFRWSRRDKYSD